MSFGSAQSMGGYFVGVSETACSTCGAGQPTWRRLRGVGGLVSLYSFYASASLFSSRTEILLHGLQYLTGRLLDVQELKTRRYLPTR